MYYADTGAGTLDAFDYDVAAGTASNRTTIATFTPEGGLPDGLAVDADGGVWVALFRGGRVVRLSPSGELVDAVELPVSQPTSVAFGGDDLGDLYITTATYEMSDEQLAAEPLAGATLVCRPGVVGTPVAAFAG
jgi:sugar lactone lactonase YvrE